MIFVLRVNCIFEAKKDFIVAFPYLKKIATTTLSCIKVKKHALRGA